jgi:hypothetical protein
MASASRWLISLALVCSLARIIAGETPGCSMQAKLAVAHVYHNRLAVGIEGGWFGDADPQQVDVAAVWLARWTPDPTAGALYMIGPGDRQRMPWLQTRTGRWECSSTWVESWR